MLCLGNITEYSVCSCPHFNTRNSRSLWLVRVTDWSETDGPHLLVRLMSSLFSVILYKWQQSSSQYDYPSSNFLSTQQLLPFLVDNLICCCTPETQISSQWNCPDLSSSVPSLGEAIWVPRLTDPPSQQLMLLWHKRKRSSLSLILIKHFLLLQWK